MATPQSNGILPLSASERSNVTRETYRPDIDGLRAVAALAVVGTHARVLPGGFVGVDVFFVISGYLITGLILRALARRSFSSLEFYARRIKRIFPALIALLITAATLGWLTLFADENRRLGSDIIASAGFIYNLSKHCRNDSDFHSVWGNIDIGHLWSLGVEEQFYLFWPLFLILICKLKSHQLALIAGLTAISFVVNVVDVSLGKDNYSLPWARLWQLSLGSAFAYMQAHRDAELERLRSVFSTPPFSCLGLHNNHTRGLIGAALLVASCVLLKNSSAFPGWKALAPTIGSLLIIAAGMESWLNRHVLGATPLVAVGLISYPIYLWHNMLLQIPHLISPQVTPIMTIASVIGTFILSLITYKYIELPLRHCTKTILVASVLCVVMLACATLGYAMSLGYVPARHAPPEARNFIRASTEDWLPGTQGISWTRSPDKFITLGEGSREVLYIGDSNMQQFYPRIEKLLASHPLNGRSAVFATRDWCVPVGSEIPASLGATNAGCMAFVQSAFSYAKGPRVGLLLVS